MYLHDINNIKKHNTILLYHWISEIIIKTTSESLSASKPAWIELPGNVREEYCNEQTCKMGYN
jgi:hypothetical protein